VHWVGSRCEVSLSAFYFPFFCLNFAPWHLCIRGFHPTTSCPPNRVQDGMHSEFLLHFSISWKLRLTIQTRLDTDSRAYSMRSFFPFFRLKFSRTIVAAVYHRGGEIHSPGSDRCVHFVHTLYHSAHTQIMTNCIYRRVQNRVVAFFNFPSCAPERSDGTPGFHYSPLRIKSRLIIIYQKSPDVDAENRPVRQLPSRFLPNWTVGLHNLLGVVPRCSLERRGGQ
jgi:hypothetical protein